MKQFLVMICCALLLLLAGAPAFGQSLKVAAIGNSVTFGYGLKDPAKESYPSILQGLLGKSYEVKNFGHSGATLLKNGHRPYYKTQAFADAIAYKPDIAIVHLGLNDTDPRNWPEFKDEFVADYTWLLDALRKVNPKVKLYVCRLTPIFNEHPRFKSGTREWYWQVQDVISEIAKANGVELINLTEALSNRPDLFADNLHPDREGAAIIAKTVYGKLSGDFGGLQLPLVFSNHMVLQRQQPIPVYGTADAHREVSVRFKGQTLKTTANADGKWKVTFPAMTHGGPFQLTVAVEGTRQRITLNDILIGDVWLCSGQSNMAFPLASSQTGKQELSQLKGNTNLRLLQFNELVQTDNQSWDSVTLAKINQLQLFSGAWAQGTDARVASGFSAVGYYFGQQLALQNQVPVGLIQVAVGGSTLESWIDRYTLEHDPKLVDVLTNWRKSDFVQLWARGRADVNLKLATNPKQRHPYEPAYNYEAGISKLVDFPIKGVIWYQGESNAQNVELYQHALPVLVSSWREKWHQPFPFYYVQLSSLNRPSWPYFRDAQRQLQAVIPNSGMVVSSDLGDSLDVHPVKKKEIGERLALLALQQTYGKQLRASGPVLRKAKAIPGAVVLSFEEALALKTAHGEPLQGFELVGDRGEFIPATATIKGLDVHLTIPAGMKVKRVVYAWRPFSRANLVNEAALPASTFSVTPN